MKNRQPPGIEPGPLTLPVSALPPELWPPGDTYMYNILDVCTQLTNIFFKRRHIDEIIMVKRLHMYVHVQLDSERRVALPHLKQNVSLSLDIQYLVAVLLVCSTMCACVGVSCSRIVCSVEWCTCK